MTFDDPIPFAEALDTLEKKDLLATGLSTAELRELPAEIRDVSIFSARMNKAGSVQRFRDLCQQILSPSNRAPSEGINIATARARFQDYLRDEGYDSEKGGFAGEEKVPFAERGSLRDLSSNPRLELMLKTKVTQIAQAGYKIQQDTPIARRAYPCWELVRVGVLKNPEAARDWPRRWAKVDGKFYGNGRMIAPKGDPIWERLGSPDEFDDAIGTETPPYAYGSHETRRALARAVCIDLGVIAPDFVPGCAAGSPIKATAQASAVPFSRDFLADLRKDLGAEVEDGRIRLAANAAPVSIEHLARWLTFLVLTATNVGTSEGAYKGWETRRMLSPDTGGGAGGGSVHPLDAGTPLNADDAARLMLSRPDHPTTRAFQAYLRGGHNAVNEEHGNRIDAMLRRLPPHTADPVLFRGLSMRTTDERDQEAAALSTSKVHRIDQRITGASVDPGVAKRFSSHQGPGIVLAIKPGNTARDIRPIVKALAPEYRHQQEIALLRGSRYRVTGESTTQTPSGKTPVFGLESV